MSAHSRRPRSLRLTQCVLVALLGSAAAAQPALVATLEISPPVPSRGRLGGITVDRQGRIYAANFDASVYRVDPDGRSVLISDALETPSGNAIDSEGRLLQSSFEGNRIIRFNADGEAETIVSEGLNGPVGLVEGTDGRLFICNCRDGSIAVARPDEAATRLVRSELLACANGLTWLRDGSLAVVTFTNAHVLRVSLDGSLELLTTLPGDTGNSHVARLGDDLFVTRVATNDIYRVRPDGTFDRVAGTGEAGHRDGLATQALLAHPNGIASAPRRPGVLVFNDLSGVFRGEAATTIRLRTLTLPTGEPSP